MQLMCDAVAVLGSRHGLIFNPIGGCANIVRFDAFADAVEIEIAAGLVVNGERFVFPLCKDGRRFAFCDQRLEPNVCRWIGIEPATGLKVTLEFATPFRPRDTAFSVTPVLGIRLQAERISGNFRWTPVTSPIGSAELFFEIEGKSIEIVAGGESLDLHFVSGTARRKDWDRHPSAREVPQTDRLIVRSGERSGPGFRQPLDAGEPASRRLEIAWCTFSEAILEVRGQRCPFKYREQFSSLEEVCRWADRHGGEIFANAARVTAAITDNNLSASINHLLAQTLHSWLVNTWWVVRGDGDWFSVWEGNCHFHSTIDVEFTQAPFYLVVWPELLGLQLDMWPEFAQDGSGTLGERGAGTLFMAHDCGEMCTAEGQAYHHDMEVEETTNYLILAFVYWRRTADASILRKHESTLRRFLAFLRACDTKGRGLPDVGVANTIDDGSPAIQFGREQVYLAVKTMVAFQCGAAILEALGDPAGACVHADAAAFIRSRIEAEGWNGEHFVTLLCRSADGLKDPWTGHPMEGEEVPGWDSCHIYTANALAVLDMVGFDSGLNREYIVRDLEACASRCLREYGCTHTDYAPAANNPGHIQDGMVGASGSPGWISMNMLRDMAAFYRGVDLRHLADRYWEWQVTTNTQEPCLFFETFGGNNLRFYPRGVAVWGFLDALAGRVIDRVAGIESCQTPFPGVRLPCLPQYPGSW